MATVMMVCSVGHHWAAVIADWGTFETQLTAQSQGVLCPRCGEICVHCTDFYSGDDWLLRGGVGAGSH